MDTLFYFTQFPVITVPIVVLKPFRFEMWGLNIPVNGILETCCNGIEENF